jgi:uncharacterized membrane protein
MEFVFGLIALLVAAGILTFIPYMVYENWNNAKRALKNEFSYDDGILGILYILIGIILATVIFITLCAFNNTFWHLDYLTTEGIWEK